MGVTWTMEVFSWLIHETSWVFYLTDFINCIQGVLIFFLFVWKPRVKALLRKKFQKQNDANASAKNVSDEMVASETFNIQLNVMEFDDM